MNIETSLCDINWSYILRNYIYFGR